VQDPRFRPFQVRGKEKQREAKRRQTVVEVKESSSDPRRTTTTWGSNPRRRKFLEGGNKVRVVCRFRGREITHPELANQQLDAFIVQLEDVAIWSNAHHGGKSMAIVLGPKPQVFQRIAQERLRREEERARQPQGEAQPADEEAEDQTDEDGGTRTTTTTTTPRLIGVGLLVY